MGATLQHAERELDILISTAGTEPDERPIIEPYKDEILALVKKFGESGQSGGSAPYTARALSMAIEKLCLQEPICDIMGTDNEWVDVSELNDGTPLYQNNRCYALFKEGKEGRAYYLDAIIWEDQDRSAFTGTALNSKGERIYSRAYVKSFPFTPKSFYIDRISIEVKPDDWEGTIKDESQLEEVFQYYDKYEDNS